MKKTLTISIKSSHQALGDFAKALKLVRQKKMQGTHYEISFDNKKSFDHFVKNIGILSLISKLKPKSVYELAKLADMDVSNLNKIILFFEEFDVIKVVRKKVDGRTVAKPIVKFDKIEFDLAV